MTKSVQIIKTLKKLLKTKGLTYAQLAEKLDLSEASVKRVFSQQSFTLDRLDLICDILEIDYYDLVRISYEESGLCNRLTDSQEKALANDVRLLAMFFMVLDEWPFERMSKDMQFSEQESIILLAQLDRLGIIELQVNNRYRLKVDRNFEFNKDGPLMRKYEQRVISEFFQGRFNKSDEKLCYEIRELSPASAQIIMRKLIRLNAEITELANLDAILPADQKKRYGFIGGLRPWTPSFVDPLRRFD